MTAKKRKTLIPVDFYECTIEGCQHATSNPCHSDPRRRWVIGLKLKNELDQEISINLCPDHVKALLPVSEEFFQQTQRTEEFVQRGTVEAIH